MLLDIISQHFANLKIEQLNKIINHIKMLNKA